MSRRIVLTDVTAMAGDAVCIAGVDLATHETLRLSRDQPTNQMLKQFGGLAPGDIIEVDAQRLASLAAPHVEDCHWMPRSLKKIGTMSVEKIRAFVEPSLFTSLEAAFGTPAARTGGRNRGWAPGTGARSLASLSVRYVRIHDRSSGGRYARRSATPTATTGKACRSRQLSARAHRPGCDDCRDGSLAHLRADFEANRRSSASG